jgi:Phage integrase family
MHTLRHTAAMRLLLAGNDVTVIALWLGHEQVSTTNIYLHADMTHKQQAIDRTKPLAAKPGRYRPPTPSWPSSRRCDYADPNTAITPADNTFHRTSA